MIDDEKNNFYQTFCLDLISPKRNIKLELSVPPQDFLIFLKVFDIEASYIGKSIKWNNLQQKDEELMHRVNGYVASMKNQFPQLISIVSQFFSYLNSGECFYLLKHRNRTTKEMNELWSRLGVINEKVGLEVFDKEKYNWGTTVLYYNIDFFGDQRKSFGTQGKNKKKICRFCNYATGEMHFRNSEVSFSKKAHLISEALGNKRLISLDECNSCNEYFSEEIEPSIVNFFALFRSLYGIPGKGGKKKVKGNNFDLDPDQGFNIQFPGTFLDFPEGELNMELHLKENYRPVDVYRTLVKFLLAIVPREDLHLYKKTIDWLFGRVDDIDLPHIAQLKQANFYTEHPKLIKYKRIINDTAYPDLIGEFRYGDILMIFIVPFSAKDDKLFTNQDDIDLIWEDFIGLRKNLPWSFIDFSSNEPVKMKVDFEVNNIKLGENAFLSKQNNSSDLS